MNRVTKLAVVLGAAALVAACGDGADPSSADLSGPPDVLIPERPGPKVDSRKLVDMFGFVDYRYAELDETEQLATSSVTDAAVTGTVVGFEYGPKLYPDGGRDSGATMVMNAAVDTVLGGQDLSPRLVSVLLPAGPGHTVRDFAAAMPPGAEMVLYLGIAKDLPDNAPDGLMSPVSPQGFVVSEGRAEEDGIVYPLAHELVADESLVDQIPR